MTFDFFVPFVLFRQNHFDYVWELDSEELQNYYHSKGFRFLLMIAN